MRIAITGATGLVGSNLLLEIIKQNVNNLRDIHFLILGKGKNGRTLQQRIENILLTDGPNYIGRDQLTDSELLAISQENISYIELQLSRPDMGITDEEAKALHAAPIDFFFHSAGVTDFRDAPEAVQVLEMVNLHGTKRMIELTKTLDVREFDYVSTAYACGETYGDIQPDYVNLDQGFRNPYERVKLEAEMEVRQFQKETGVKCRYFRPSVICGRLMEDELGATPKFDVFYLWAAFFVRWKMKLLSNGSPVDVYGTPLEMDLRFWGNRGAGLNIVPVDYAVKAMWEVCKQDAPGESFHLVGDQETLHFNYTACILDWLNITGPRFVDEPPTDLNRLESFYYKTVGKIFMPYATQDPIYFRTDNLTAVTTTANLTCPPIDDSNLRILLNYAKKHQFGLSLNGSSGAKS